VHIIKDIESKFSLPVVLKPATQGSSIGVTIVKEENQLTKAVTEALTYDPILVVEQYLNGREFMHLPRKYKIAFYFLPKAPRQTIFHMSLNVFSNLQPHQKLPHAVHEQAFPVDAPFENVAHAILP